MTGATGLVGAEVCAALAAQGCAVVALVHRNRDVVRNNGRRLRLRDGPVPGAVCALPSDVSAPGLGLAEPVRSELTASLDVVIHSAAVTDFGRPPGLYEAVNLRGTKNVLELAASACRGPLPLLYVSTAYVCGERSGPVLESELEVGQAFANPYEDSKHRAERRVRDAIARGHPAAIVRPSIVVGESRSGRIRDFKNMYVVLRVLTQGRVRSIPGSYDATLDLVPLDYVSRAIARLALRMDEAAGRTFHLVGRRPATLLDFSDTLAEYPTMHVPRFVPPAGFDLEALPVVERKYYERIIGLYESYFRRRVEFVDDAARAFLGAHLPKPPSGRGLLRKCLDYCEEVGYLGAPTAGVEDALAMLEAP